MSLSATQTQTGTYTEARARQVIGKVYEDFLGMLSANLIEKSEADRWRTDLLYIASQEALSFFEIQFIKPDGTQVGLRYELDDSGNIYLNDDSGGIDYYDLPKGTRASIFVELRDTAYKYQEVLRELIQNRGWGSGAALEGSSTFDRAYSSSGYGLNRNRIGQW